MRTVEDRLLGNGVYSAVYNVFSYTMAQLFSLRVDVYGIAAEFMYYNGEYNVTYQASFNKRIANLKKWSGAGGERGEDLTGYTCQQVINVLIESIPASIPEAACGPLNLRTALIEQYGDIYRFSGLAATLEELGITAMPQ